MTARTPDDPLAAWQPTPEDPFDFAAATHLYDRAAFGASPAVREAAVSQGLAASVDALFTDGPGTDPDPLLPRVLAIGEAKALRSYRIWRILHGNRPLRERLSHFWHDHFATSLQKVKDVSAMAHQFATFDRLGAGSFDELLLAMARDPAMIRWLDNESNIAKSPNENFARELLELFALGRGDDTLPQAYTEQDVREAARAFTGWTVRERRFHFLRSRHDGTAKTVLGVEGVQTGEQVIALAAKHPASARFLARKLLAFFVHPLPTEDEVSALARVWIEQDRHIGATLDRLLRSKLFFSTRARQSRIRDPLDLVVGMVRNLGCTAAPEALADRAAAMGMVIGEPPSVEGWVQERAWLTSATWITRSNFAAELAEGGLRCNPSATRALAGGTPKQRSVRAVQAVTGGRIGARSQERLDALLRETPDPENSSLLHAVTTLPEAQLL